MLKRFATHGPERRTADQGDHRRRKHERGCIGQHDGQQAPEREGHAPNRWSDQPRQVLRYADERIGLDELRVGALDQARNERHLRRLEELLHAARGNEHQERNPHPGDVDEQEG